MADKVLTAPLALIKVNGVTIGKMKNLRITETFRRGRVSGIGEVVASEVPVLEFNGTVTSEFYEIDFSTTGIPDAIKRKATSVQGFIDNILLQEEGVNIVIFKKVTDFTDPQTGLLRAKLKEHATITRAFIDREGMDVSEGQISGHNQDFTYLDPILSSL
jgi:hypothetical protein